MTNNIRERVARIGPNDEPVLEGSLLGIAVWVLGYTITYVIVEPDLRASRLHRVIEAMEGAPSTHEMVGWVFFNAHFVQTVFTDLPVIETYSMSMIGGEQGFTVLLYLVPVVLLVVAGAIAARYQPVHAPISGAVAGLTVVPGYLLCAVLGVLLFEVTLAGARAGPNPVTGILFAGIAYPLIVAGASGAVIGGLRPRDGTDGGPRTRESPPD